MLYRKTTKTREKIIAGKKGKSTKFALKLEDVYYFSDKYHISLSFPFFSLGLLSLVPESHHKQLLSRLLM